MLGFVRGFNLRFDLLAREQGNGSNGIKRGKSGFGHGEPGLAEHESQHGHFEHLHHVMKGFGVHLGNVTLGFANVIHGVPLEIGLPLGSVPGG